MTEALSRLNFRDVGGLPAAGGIVRHGVIYRSEGPASFLAAHHQELEALGIRLICDLRADVERKAAPNGWSRTARIFDIELTHDLRNATNQGWGALRNDPSEAGARAAMRGNYVAIPGALHPHIGAVVSAIAGGETPVLIHCTAGKDRTGVLVALLLSLLDVPYEAIVRDYLRSDIFAKNLRLGGSIADAFEKTFGFVPSEATINAMIGVDAAFLQAAFDEIGRHWPSLDAYFTTAGIDDDMARKFRQVMTAKTMASA